MSVNLPKVLSDHPSLVGITRFPMCNYNTQELDIPIVIKDSQGYLNLVQRVDVAETINNQSKTSASYSVPKSNVTDFYPYSYYVLTDGETEPLIMYPQYLGSSVSIKGEFALSHQPIERYYPTNYKGSTDGSIYNITNFNQMMLPTASNEGLQYMNANANSIMQNRKNQVTGNILNAVVGVGTALVGGPSPMSLVSTGASVISGINSIKETDARNKDMMLTPSTISSFGTPSTRQAFGTDNVRLIRYTIKDNVKNKINAFIDRYGNKYNNYSTVDLKNYKGYVKFISPDIDSKIDNKYTQQIISILERGVYCE